GAQSAEAVANEIDLRCACLGTEQLDLLPQTVRQPLIVDAGRIGEGREVREARGREMAAQHEEVGGVTEEAVYQDGRGGVGRYRIEVLSTDDQPERHRQRRCAHC